MKKYILKHKLSALEYFIMGTVTSLNGIAMTYGIQYVVEIVTNNQTEKIPNMFFAVALYFFGMMVFLFFMELPKTDFA